MNRRRLAIALMGTATMVACSDNSPVTSPSRPLAPSSVARHDELPPEDGTIGFIQACKEGGPAGRYHFKIATTGGGDLHPPVMGADSYVDYDGVNIACVSMGGSINRASWVGKGPAQITLTETQIPASQQVDSIIVSSSTTGITEAATPKGQTSKTMTYNYQDRLWFSFYNGVMPVSRTPGTVEACQTMGPKGTYTFLVSVKGGGAYSLPNGKSKTVQFNGTTPVCVTMYQQNSTAWVNGTAPATVTIISLPPFGNDPRTYALTKNGNAADPVYNDNTAPISMAYGDGASVSFTASPWNVGNQACSIGFWKNASFASKWAGTGYSRTQLVNTIINVPSGYMKSGKNLGAYTMLEALSFTGGSTTSGKAELLIRSTVAGLLNANHTGIKYPAPGSTLTLATDVALATNSSWAMQLLQLATDAMNASKGGCPID